MTIKCSVDAPWGKFECDTYLDFFRQCRAQLQYFLDQKQSPNEEFTRAELAGYDELLATGSEDMAEAFAMIKHDCRERGVAPPTNLEVIHRVKREAAT